MSKFIKSITFNPLVILWVALFGGYIIQLLATTTYPRASGDLKVIAEWLPFAYFGWAAVLVVWITKAAKRWSN